MSHWISILGVLVVIGYIFIIYSILHTSDCKTINVPNPNPVVSNQGEVKLLKEKIGLLQNMLSETKRVIAAQTTTEVIPAPPLIESETVQIVDPVSLVVVPGSVSVSNTHNTYKNQGIIILGMHRSGTSVVGGLMNAMGLNTGGSLIRPGNDNEKGFF